MIWFLEINSENFALFDNPTPRKILQFLYDNMTWSVPPTRSIGINISNEAKRGRLGSYERHLTKYRKDISRSSIPRRFFPPIDRSIDPRTSRQDFSHPFRPLASNATNHSAGTLLPA